MINNITDCSFFYGFQVRGMQEPLKCDYNYYKYPFWAKDCTILLIWIKEAEVLGKMIVVVLYIVVVREMSKVQGLPVDNNNAKAYRSWKVEKYVSHFGKWGKARWLTWDATEAIEVSWLDNHRKRYTSLFRIDKPWIIDSKPRCHEFQVSTRRRS